MLVYIRRNEEVFGPYSVEETREYLSDGRLSLSDFAQLPGTTEWIPLASVPGVKSAPPPPVAPQPQRQPTELPHPKKSNNLFSWPVIRDFFIVLGLQAIGCFIIGFRAGYRGEQATEASYGYACAFLGTIGFAITGYLATGKRWEHLTKVAALTTFAYVVLSNTYLHDTSATRYLINFAAAFFLMGLGGALSYLFKKSEKELSVQLVATKARNIRVGLVLVVIIGFIAVVWLVDTSQQTEKARENPNSSAKEIVALQQAAEGGDAWAQSKLGWMFANGDAVPQNYEEAFKWYSLAAKQGDSMAQNNLGVMYHNGQGVRPDDLEAYRLYCLSAAQGNTNAINNRNILLKSMNQQQIAEGQREAANSSPTPESVAAAEFRRDFFEKYPDLIPYESVVDAVALKLQASGYKGESREAVMEKFAEEARKELARQRASQSSPQP